MRVSRKLDSFVADDAMSVGEAGEHIVAFQTRIGAQEIVRAVAGRQHSENVFDRQAATSKGRLPTEDFRVYRNSFEQQSFSHVYSSSRIIAATACDGPRYGLPYTYSYSYSAVALIS